MIWYDMIWYDMIWYDMKWYDMSGQINEWAGGWLHGWYWVESKWLVQVSNHKTHYGERKLTEFKVGDDRVEMAQTRRIKSMNYDDFHNNSHVTSTPIACAYSGAYGYLYV